MYFNPLWRIRSEGYNFDEHMRILAFHNINNAICKLFAKLSKYMKWVGGFGYKNVVVMLHAYVFRQDSPHLNNYLHNNTKKIAKHNSFR